MFHLDSLQRIFSNSLLCRIDINAYAVYDRGFERIIPNEL